MNIRAVLALAVTGCALVSGGRVLDRTLFLSEIPLSTTYSNGDMWTGFAGRWTDWPLLLNRTVRYEPGNYYRISTADLSFTLEQMRSYGLDGATFNSRSDSLLKSAREMGDKIPTMFIPNLQLKGLEGDSYTARKTRENLGKALATPGRFMWKGSPLVVSYWTDRSHTPEQMSAALAKARAEHGHFWFVPDVSSLSKWKWREKWQAGKYDESDAEEMRELMRRYLRVADGIYFGEYIGIQHAEDGEKILGINYYRDVVLARVKEVFSEPEFKGKKLLGLVAGLGHGNPYTFGNTIGQDGTRTLRYSVKEALACAPDFVVFFEWDEWNENTLIKPTLWNSFAPKRIIRAQIADARGEVCEPLAGDNLKIPNLILSFRKTMVFGEKAVFEVLSVPERGASGMAEITLTLKNEDGAVLCGFKPKSINLGIMDEIRFTAASEEWAPSAAVIPELQVKVGGETRRFENGLPFAELRTGGSYDHKWATIPLRDVATNAACMVVAEMRADGICRARISGSADEGIDRLELTDGGDVVYSKCGKEDEEFREDDTNAVFAISAFLRIYTDELEKRKGHPTLSVTGVSRAEWQIAKDRTVGNKVELRTACVYTPDTYLRIPKSDISAAELTLNWAGVTNLTISLPRIMADGRYAVAGRDGFSFSVSRFMRHNVFGSAVGTREAKGEALIQPDRPVSVLGAHIITPEGKLFRSRPVVIGRRGGLVSQRVYSVTHKGPRQIRVDAARVLDARWNFSERLGVVASSGWATAADGILGGSLFVATHRNRGGASFFHSCPGGWSGNPSRAPRQIVEDGEYVLEFDGSGTYFAVPGGVIPRFAAYRLTFEFKPNDVSREQELFACGTASQYGNVGCLALKDGKLKVLFCGLHDEDTHVVSSGRVIADEWNRVELVWNVDTAELVVNGVSSGKVPCVMPGRSDCASWFGGRNGKLFCGRVRRVRIAHDGALERKTPRILPRTLVLTQTQFYPLRERGRGYLGRYVDNPLCIDPDVATNRVKGSYLTVEEFERTQLDALSYGLDGLAYFPDKERRAYEQGRASSVRGAKNVPIVCFWNPAKFEEDAAVVGNAIKDPRAYKVNGKTLILSYWTEKFSSAKRVGEITQELKRRFGDTFLFLPDIQSLASHRYRGEFTRHHALPNEMVAEIKDKLRAFAAASDGLYVGETHMMSKVCGSEKVFDGDFYACIVALMREVLDEPAFKGSKLLALSAICGHENAATVGRNTAADGTRTLRKSFAVAASAMPDVILLPEWDEYNENTCFAPTLYNSYAVKRIVRSMIAELHGEQYTAITGDDTSIPNLVLSWRKSISPGERLYIEALNVPDGSRGGRITCAAEVMNEEGVVLRTFTERELQVEQMDETRFEMDTAGLADRARALCIRFSWRGEDGVRHVIEDGLHPVDFAIANSWNQRVVRQPLRDLARMSRTELTVEDGELHVELACAEPIRYVMLCGNGQIQYIRGSPDSPCMRFRDDASNAVFQISALSWNTAVDRNAALKLVGVNSAEWMRYQWGPVEKGKRFRLGWMSMATEPIYLRIPAALEGVKLECDFPGVISGTIPLDRARHAGSFVLGASGGAQIVVTRFDGQSFYPSVMNSPHCCFTAPISADRESNVYWVQVVTMAGRTWRSKPWKSEPSVAARHPVLEYDFSPENGDAVVAISGGRRFSAMAGGPYSPVAQFNRNGFTSGGMAPSSPYFKVAVDGRPRRVRREDGKWAMEFDGKDDFVAFPHETIPVCGDFTISFEVRPDESAARMTMMSAKYGTRGSLYAISLDNGELVIGYSALEGWMDLRTGISLPVGEWSRVEISKCGASIAVSSGGKSVVRRYGLIGDSTAPLYLGWCYPDRPFRGAMADLRVIHR